MLDRRIIDSYIKKFPIIEDIMNTQETFWLNQDVLPFDQAISTSMLSKEDIIDASDRLKRFASYFKKVFPETAVNDGIIESPFQAIPNMQKALEKKYGQKINGELLVKLDSNLAVSGSIKARGGIYEVLFVAERIAIEEGGFKNTDDYAELDTEKYKKIFAKYSIAVGSTGNLGLSIGIISAKLGFNVTVSIGI